MSAQVTPEHILRLGLGYWGSKTLLSAVELGVFTELAKGPLDAEALRERLGLHPRSARDFLDALVALGMLEREDGAYREHARDRTSSSTAAKPSYVGGILEMTNARLYGFWGSLTEGAAHRPAAERGEAGGDFFETLYADPERLRAVPARR